MSIRETILNSIDRKIEPCEAPEWGSSFYLRELSLSERLALSEEFTKEGNQSRNLYAYAVLYSACDADGNRVFAVDDYEALAGKNPNVVLRVGKQAAILNRLVGDVIEDQKKS